MNKELFDYAKQYIEQGWFVFPLHSIDSHGECTCMKKGCSDAGKHPRLERGVKGASNKLEDIELWFGENSPKSNIGIVTGEKSGITIIDVDIGEGKFGDKTWAELIAEDGEPNTLMAETGSGGIHVFFKYNSALKTSSNTLGKGVDCRNDGGYVVAAPSLHRSGGIYKWSNWGTALANLPKNMSRKKETRGRTRKDDYYRNKYTIAQVRSMLDVVPSEDRDLWRHVGIILGREFARNEEAWELYTEWAEKDCKKKGRNHDEIMREAFYDISQQSSSKELTLATIVKAAIDNGWVPKSGETPIGHFVYYGPGNNYIYRPTMSYWIASAVDAAVSKVNDAGKIIDASEWLKQNQLATSLTCDPGILEDYTKGIDCKDGELIKVEGAAVFNTYRPPTIELGDHKLAQPFLEHISKLFNKDGDADQFLDYMAHRVQRPWEKPRFALLISGGQGVGKDTAIEFCCPAIGNWNVANIDPADLESSFNEYESAVLVRISEAANLHEMTKWAFNEKTKVLIAGSPDNCTINPKYGQKFTARRFCGVIITTNHLASGIYIPPDDRRYDVIESATMAEMGITEDETRRKYFTNLWEWFYTGGATHVAAYLHNRDISKFSPSNGQRKTAAHRTVVKSGRATDAWLLDIINDLNNPRFVTTSHLISAAEAKGYDPKDIKKKIGPTLSRLDYVLYENQEDALGRWKFFVDGKQYNYLIFARVGTEPGINPKDDIFETRQEKEVF